MYIELEKELYENEIKPRLPEQSKIVEEADYNLRWGAKEFNLNLKKVPLEELEQLHGIAKEVKNRSLQVKISPIIKVMKDTEKTVVTSLRALSMGLIEFLKKDAIDGWIYRMEDDEIPHPYLIRKVKLIMPRSPDDRPYVEVVLSANSARNSNKNGLYERNITINSDVIQGKTIREILLDKGYYKETIELKELYEEHVALFENYQVQFNEQFWIQGSMYSDFGYSGSLHKMQRAKAINDEETLKRKFTRSADADFWRENGVEQKFDEIPFHCYILMYHLDTHKQMWVHASNMTPYQYNTGLRDKLVLPQSHRDLIDILVNDMEVLQEDIIDGKSGGTTILCEGKPGLGKTLSAEVYSEVIQRPLYKVHSGQLGLRADDVERNLEGILKRASRWGAVLLLDEADVYIRGRGDDLQHNAVVASFLRTLEYFDGLLFMTTNRGDDVDDAILSRCIAVIKYETPTSENAKKIWEVLSKQFQVDISSEMIEELVERIPQASGRDIKELLKLTSRFAKGKKLPLNIETFRQCAQFRGIVMKDD